MKICPNCGYRNADGDILCANCNVLLNTGQQNTANQNSVPGGTSRRWSFRTSLIITGVLVIVFIVCTVLIFDTLSGTTVANVFHGIFDGIGRYYDSVKLFGK